MLSGCTALSAPNNRSSAAPGVCQSVTVLGGQLEDSDLSADESTFLAVLATAGRIACAPESQIRADVIQQVVTRSGPLGVAFSTFRRLEIHQAHIVGKLDLSDCVAFPVLFGGCRFTGTGESFDISRSEIRDLRIAQCAFTGDIRGENSRITGNLWFKECVVEGSANLMLASVAGSFILDGCEVLGSSEDGRSITLDGLRVDGLFQISKTRLAGSLSIREARLKSQSLVRDSQLGLADASHGQLLLQKSIFESEMTVGPNVTLTRLMGEALKSDSDLILTDVRPTQETAELNLDRVTLRGGLQIFDVAGNGHLLLRGASMSSLQIGKTCLVAPGFNPDGSVVPGLESGDNGYALSADGLQVAGDVQLGPDLLAVGEIRLIDASIGGQIQYKRGQSTAAVLLNLESVKLGSALFLDDMNPRSVVHLAAANVGGIFIDPANIPHISLLRAEYKFINDEDGRPPSIDVACDLLARDTMAHNAVPYRRLARWFSDELGDERASRAILIAGEKRRGQGRSKTLRAVDNVWRWTVGYGYAPSRAIWPFLALVGLATIIFAAASGFTDPVDWAAAPTVVPVGTPQPVFNPFLYALSATVPFLPDFLSPWAPSSPLMQLLTVVFQILGWLLITALVAGVANRLRRRS